MNFTREPIIETIISPKEGCKLLVRSSRGSETAEEYHVDAIEVVSFGRAFFFRSMERPKAFLLPVSDYEVIEVKEPRVALKTTSHDRHIKIGGGREVSGRQAQKESSVEQEAESMSAVEEEGVALAESEGETLTHSRADKRRDRRRRRHRRLAEEQEWGARRSAQPSDLSKSAESSSKEQRSEVEDETKVSSPILPSLIPPPATLISQTLSRYKGKDVVEEATLPQEVKEEKKKKDLDEPTGSDATSVQRILVEDSPPSAETERNSYLF